MTFRVHDQVEHKSYPGTQGKVVGLLDGVVVVLWDKVPNGQLIGLPARLRTSRHIPGALQHVQ